MSKKENSKLEKAKETFIEGKQKAKESLKKADEFIKKSPYKAIAIVAGTTALLGAFVGFIFRKKKL